MITHELRNECASVNELSIFVPPLLGVSLSVPSHCCAVSCNYAVRLKLAPTNQQLAISTIRPFARPSCTDGGMGGGYGGGMGGGMYGGMGGMGGGYGGMGGMGGMGMMGGMGGMMGMDPFGPYAWLGNLQMAVGAVGQISQMLGMNFQVNDTRHRDRD